MIGYSKEQQIGKREKPTVKENLTVRRKPMKKVSKKQTKELEVRRKLKAQLIKESQGLCMACGKKPDKKDGWGELHLSHTTSLAKGGKTDRDNCQVLCRACHLELHHIKEL